MGRRRGTVGMDGSAAAFRALDAAAAEAALRGARLEVVHCVPDRDEAGPVLRSAASRVKKRHPELPVTTSAEVDDPVDVLAERSRTSEMVVVGFRGRTRLPGLPPLSVSRRLAARALGPLLVVRERGPVAPGSVLLGLESDLDTDAALFAFEEAGLRRAPLRVLHAWTYRRQPFPGTAEERSVKPLPEGIGRRARAASALREPSVAPLRAAAPEGTTPTAAVRAPTHHALIEATGTAALVVIAAHPGHAWIGRQLGPVAEALLRHSPCPVGPWSRPGQVRQRTWATELVS